MIALLREQGQGLRGVFHCFIGDQAMARDALDLGFYLSFAGPVTYPKNDRAGARSPPGRQRIASWWRPTAHT